MAKRKQTPKRADPAPEAAEKLLPELQALFDYHDAIENGERGPDDAEFEHLVFALYGAAIEQGATDMLVSIFKPKADSKNAVRS